MRSDGDRNGPLPGRQGGADGAHSPWGSRVLSRQQQRGLKEEALYETAARLFNQHGFHGTSLADLATELGITKAALYNYVADKSELLYRLHLRSLAAAQQARDRAVAEGKNGLDRIRLVNYYYICATTASPTETFILLEEGVLNAAQTEEILARRRWLERDFRDLLRQGVADGSIAPCDPKLTAYAIIGMQNWVSKWYRPDGPWQGPQIAAAMSAMIVRMLGTGQDAVLPQDVSQLDPAAMLPLSDLRPDTNVTADDRRRQASRFQPPAND